MVWTIRSHLRILGTFDFSANYHRSQHLIKPLVNYLKWGKITGRHLKQICAITCKHTNPFFIRDNSHKHTDAQTNERVQRRVDRYRHTNHDLFSVLHANFQDSRWWLMNLCHTSKKDNWRKTVLSRRHTGLRSRPALITCVICSVQISHSVCVWSVGQIRFKFLVRRNRIPLRLFVCVRPFPSRTQDR